MKKYLYDYAYLLGIAGVIVGFDYWTKWLVRTNLVLGEQWTPWPWLSPYARIVYWHNTGAAFGIFQNMNDFFSILAVIVAAIILYYFPQVPSGEWHLRLAMSLQLGGAVGNLIDRLREGFVIDFVSVGTFAVFNVADASISIGVAVLVLGVLVKDWRSRQSANAAGQAPHEIVDDPEYGDIPAESTPPAVLDDRAVDAVHRTADDAQESTPDSSNARSLYDQAARSTE